MLCNIDTMFVGHAFKATSALTSLHSLEAHLYGISVNTCDARHHVCSVALAYKLQIPPCRQHNEAKPK